MLLRLLISAYSYCPETVLIIVTLLGRLVVPRRVSHKDFNADKFKEPSPVKSSYRNVGKWDSEANMAPKKEPSRKVLDKHAKFLAAWEAAGFPDKFENEGTWLNNVRSTAEWYREQKQKAAKD